MTSKRIVIATRKGGCGKTTTAVHLAVTLATSGKQVLLVDVDPQGSASRRLIGSEEVDRRGANRSSVGIISGFGTTLQDAATETSIKNLWLLPSHDEMERHAFPALESDKGTWNRLKDELDINLPKECEYVIFDTPPSSLSLPTINAIAAANYALSPIIPEVSCAEQMGSEAEICALAGTTFIGFVLTMVQKNREHDHVVKEVRAQFGNEIFETTIPRATTISRSMSEATRISTPHYQQLAGELIGRISGTAQRAAA